MIRFLQSGNKAAKYILSGFLLIICVSMVWYLVPSSTTDTNTARTGIVASVAGEDIRTDEVNKLVQTQLRMRQYPESVAPFIAQQVIQQLIQRQEVRYEAGRLGLKASDQEVRDELQNGMYKTYFFPGGKWIGQEAYEKFLTENGTTVSAFESDVRDSLLGRKLFSAITAGVNVPSAEVEKAYKDRNTKVKFQYAVLSLEEIQKQIKTTDAELNAFYNANKARYQNGVSEKRQIRYFVLEDKDAEGKVTVDASDLQRYYGSHQEEYRIPERVKVRHILISIPPPGPDGKPDSKAVDVARAKAADVLKQVKAGGDFAELAKKNSQDPGSAQDGGELGWIIKGQTVAEFEKIAFSQNKGQTSDLVQSSFGFHIIQTEDKEQARVKPLSEVKGQIESVIKAQKAGAFLDQAATDAQDLAQRQGLDKAAAQRGAPVVQSNLVGSKDALPGVGASPELMAAVFAAPEKGPQVARYAQGYMIFAVTKIEPPRTPAFTEIKERVTNDFKGQRAYELLQKKTQELADRAHAGHDLAKAAKEAGATVKTSELVSRTSQVPEIGPMNGQASAAFALKPGEISGPLRLGQGQKSAVLAVTERQEPSLTDAQFAHERDSLLEQLSEQKKGEALNLFMSNLDSRLKKEGKLKPNEAEMNSLTKSRS